MLVLTCQKGLRFTIGDIEFTVKAIDNRYTIDAPDEVRVQRITDQKAPLGARYPKVQTNS